MFSNESPFSPGFIDPTSTGSFEKVTLAREDIDVRINLNPGPDMIQKSGYGLLKAIMHVNSSYVSLSAAGPIHDQFTNRTMDQALENLSAFFLSIPQKYISLGNKDGITYRGIDMKEGIDVSDGNPMSIIFAKIQAYDTEQARDMLNLVPLAHLIPTENGIKVKNPAPQIDSANMMFSVVTHVIG